MNVRRGGSPLGSRVVAPYRTQESDQDLVKFFRQRIKATEDLYDSAECIKFLRGAEKDLPTYDMFTKVMKNSQLLIAAICSSTTVNFLNNSVMPFLGSLRNCLALSRDTFVVPLAKLLSKIFNAPGFVDIFAEDYLFKKRISGSPVLGHLHQSSKNGNLWELNKQERMEQLRKWEEDRVRAPSIDSFNEQIRFYDEAERNLRQIKDLKDFEAIRNCSIIRCTTTGASKYFGLIEILKPDVFQHHQQPLFEL